MLKQNVIVEIKDMVFICMYIIFYWFILRDTVTLAPNFDPKYSQSCVRNFVKTCKAFKQDMGLKVV